METGEVGYFSGQNEYKARQRNSNYINIIRYYRGIIRFLYLSADILSRIFIFTYTTELRNTL